MLEEFQTHLKTEEDRRDEAKDKLDKASKILVNVKAGVEHLADKLQHLKAVRPYLLDLCIITIIVQCPMGKQIADWILLENMM